MPRAPSRYLTDRITCLMVYPLPSLFDLAIALLQQ